VERRIYAYPYASYRHGLSERSKELLEKEYRNAGADRQIVVFVKDSGTRRLISFSIDEDFEGRRRKAVTVRKLRNRVSQRSQDEH
jgi:hypothetical protein